MFGSGGGNTASQTVQVYNGIQVSGSTYAQALPLLYGRRRLPFTLLWYGDFQVTPNTDGGAGKGAGQQSPSSYFYNASFAAALCEGPIQGVYTVYHDQAISSLTDENMSLSLGGSAPAIWGYLTSNFPSQAIPYDHIAYVATENYAFGTSASMPNLTFETQGLFGYSTAHSIFDAQASDIVSDYLSRAGFKGTVGTLTGSTNSWQAYVNALNIFLSPLEDTQRNANDFLKEILQITNSDIVISAGTLKVIPYVDVAVSGTDASGASWSYTPPYISSGVLYALNDDDFVGPEADPPLKWSRKATADTYNSIPVEYCDAANQYNTELAVAEDLNDIATNGRRAMSTLSFHEITNATTALQVANLILNTNLYERITYEFKLRHDFCLLEPMDYVSITDSRLGLTNQVIRITEVTDEDDDLISIKAMHVSGTARTTPIYAWAGAAGYTANYAVDPGNVNQPVFIDATSTLVSTVGGRELWIAVDGQTANSAWYGCNIYMSFDASTYRLIGQISGGGARYGTIGNGSTGIGAVPDPDTTSTLQVNLNNTTLQMSGGSASDWNNMRTLIAVDSGANIEIMSYENCTLISAGVYALTNLRRGLYGTPVAAHANNAQFVRLDGNMFQLPIDPGWIGLPTYFIFASFNLYGQTPASQAISGLGSYTHTISNNGVAYDGVTQGSFSTEGYAVMFSPTTGGKTQAGAGNVWDSAIYSDQGFTNGSSASCYLAVNSPTLGLLMIGLTLNPTASVSYTNLAYGLYAGYGGGGNQIEIYEGGTQVGSGWGTWAIGDELQVTHDGKHVAYYHNGVLLRSVPQGSATYFMQLCLLAQGSGAYGISFGSLSNVVTPFTIKPMTNNVAAVGTGVYANAQDSTTHWGSRCFQSIQGYNSGLECSAQMGNASVSIVFGFANAPATGDTTGIANVTAGWIAVAGSSLSMVAFGATYNSALSAASTSDILTVTYDNYTIRWWRNGYLTGSYYSPNSGMIPYYLFGDIDGLNGSILNVYFGQFGQQSPNPFVGYGSAVCHDSTALKSGATTAWDSAAWSINAYGNCHVQGKITGSTDYGMIGLSTLPIPPASNNYAGLNFAIYNPGGGTYDIYEAGANVLNTGITPAATDLLVITYDGNVTVCYYINGALIKTTTTGGALTLYAGLVMYEQGCAFNSVSFGPGTQIDSVPTAGLDSNAATNISISTASSTSVGYVTDTVITSQTVGPFNAACTLVCTITGQWQFLTGTNPDGLLMSAGVGLSVGAGFKNVVHMPTISYQGASQQSTGIIADEQSFSLAQGSTATVYFTVIGSWSNSSTSSTNILNATLKVEAIKK